MSQTLAQEIFPTASNEGWKSQERLRLSIVMVSQKQYRQGWDARQKVGSGNFARLVLGALNIDDVVNQLEGNANAFAELLQRFLVFARCTRDQCTDLGG